MSVDAVLLAGGACGKLDSSAPYKGLLEIAGRPMIEYVLDALEATSAVDHVAVVVPSAAGLAAWADRADKIVIHDEGVVANLLAGVDSFGYGRHILAMAADIPLVTAASIDAFLVACHPLDFDAYYPILAKELAEAAYPGVDRTYMALKEGTFTGGNLILINPKALEANRVVAERAFAARKSPLKMVGIFGLPFVRRFLMRRLSVAELEAKASEISGFRATTVVVAHPEIGLDVDKPSDLAIARVRIEDQQASTGTGPSAPRYT